MMDAPPVEFECLVRKKPNPLARKPWGSCAKRLQWRWLITQGYLVDYFVYPKTSNSKPKGRFDLRQVALLRPAREADETAPPYAVELIVDKHHIVLDFEYAAHHSACLQLWANAVPQSVLPTQWREQSTPARRSSIASLGQPARPNETTSDAEEETAANEPTALSSVAEHGSSRNVETVVMAGQLYCESAHAAADASWQPKRFELTSTGQLHGYELGAGPPATAPRIYSESLLGCTLSVPRTPPAGNPHAFRVTLSEARHGKKLVLSCDSAAESSAWQEAILALQTATAAQHPRPSTPPRSHPHPLPQAGAGTDARTDHASTAAVSSETPPPSDVTTPAAAPGASHRRKVMVLGSTGSVGQSTLHWLSRRYAATCDIYAGTRDPSRVATPPGVTPIEANMDEPRVGWLAPLDCLIVITPGNTRRVEVTIAVAAAACDAGVPALLIMSSINCDASSSAGGGIFAEQFRQIETAVTAQCAATAGRTRYTFARFPLFLENYLAFAAMVRSEAAIRCCIDPLQRYSPVAVTDIGEALATIAADTTGAYADRALSLAGEAHTVAEFVGLLNEARGHTHGAYPPVRYERVSSEAMLGIVRAADFLEWQAKATVELYDLISRGAYCFSAGPLREVLGHPPLGVREWLTMGGTAFMPEQTAAVRTEARSEERGAVGTAPGGRGAASGGLGPHAEQEATSRLEAGALPMPSARQQRPNGTPAGQHTHTPAGQHTHTPAGRHTHTPGQRATARRPTVVLMEEMEEMWQTVYALECQGKLAEAAQAQAAGLQIVEERYKTNRAAYDYG